MAMFHCALSGSNVVGATFVYDTKANLEQLLVEKTRLYTIFDCEYVVDFRHTTLVT
ncbi:MAG: hypothetical protein KME40_31055 [Komarekiella atlantica HA4396-MV6]|jgi:hypothetical protein|nr:hypothetical protein [Komarekiella atlantica HA4396-MV6]